MKWKPLEPRLVMRERDIRLGLVLGAGIALLSCSASAEVLPTCFTPETRCDLQAIAAIDVAQSSIRMHAYSFTTGSGFGDALIRAFGRGVDVAVIADQTTPCGQGSALPALENAGIPVWIDYKPPIAHEKALIIDSHLVIAGSYNWTVQARANSEDMTFVDDAGNAAAYFSHWEARKAAARVYDASTEKCGGKPSGE